MHVTALSGGIGGARFLQGLLALLGSDDSVTVIANTADDIWLFGLKICPDLDTVMYTLADAIDADRGWGRAGETWRVRDELAAYGVKPDWFGLGDLDVATHVVRTQMIGAGYPLSEVTAALCARWQPRAVPTVTLLPMSDDRIETHIVIDAQPGDDESSSLPIGVRSGQRAVHFQEYWVRMHASVPVRAVVPIGIEQSSPAPGVLAALERADVVVLPPSNPIVSIGTILAVPGIADTVRAVAAPVVGLSPMVGGTAVRGMADQLLTGLDIDRTAAGVARHYGPRPNGGILDGWLVDRTDIEQVGPIEASGIRCRAVPLLMSEPRLTRQMARDTLELAAELRPTSASIHS